MNTLKRTMEICTKLGVDPGRIKICRDESQKIELQIKDLAIKQMLTKKESN